MLIVIIVKKSLKQCFGDVIETAVGAGILGVMVWKRIFWVGYLYIRFRAIKAGLPFDYHLHLPNYRNQTTKNLLRISCRFQTQQPSLSSTRILLHLTKWRTNGILIFTNCPDGCYLRGTNPPRHHLFRILMRITIHMLTSLHYY